MLYRAFDAQSDLAEQTRAWGRLVHDAVSPWTAAGYKEPLTWWSAGARMMMRAGLTFARPAYGIDSVTVGNREVPVTEEVAFATPFGTLLRFKKDVETEQRVSEDDELEILAAIEQLANRIDTVAERLQKI